MVASEPREPALVIVRGPLGVGKTTVARAVARSTGALYLSVDRLLDRQRDLGWSHGGIALRNFLAVNAVLARQAGRARRAGRRVVFDGNFYWKGQISDLERRLDRRILVVRLRGSVALCQVRDAGRPRSYGAEAVRQVHALVSRNPIGIPLDARRPVEELGRRVQAMMEEFERRSGARGP